VTCNCINLIFFASYEWNQQAKVLHNTRLAWYAIDKYFSLLGPLLNYEKNEVCEYDS
jgi:hypothetical protein